MVRSDVARYVLIAVGILVGLVGLYILDVWLVGTAAAYLSEFWTWVRGLFAGQPDYCQAAWYFHHPVSTARAWLTRSDSLSHPEVRAWWLGLNAMLAVAVAVAIAGLRIRKWNGMSGIRVRPEDTTHGSARWAEKKDLARVCDFGFGKGIVLGGIKGLFGLTPVRIPPRPKTWMNKHVLVVGAPGSGKSRGYVRPNIFAAVSSGESFIATDPKGELYRDMAAWLVSKKYVVKALNLVDMNLSDPWNPVKEIRTTLDADVFAQVVISTTETGPKKGGDSFWDRAEQNLLKALALYVTHDTEGGLRSGTMAQIYDLLAAGDFTAIDALFAKLPPGHPAKGPYNVYAMAGENVKGGVVIGLGTRLSVFQQQAVRRITDSSEIDLALPGKKKCAYFVITPDTHGAFDFLASLFFTFLFVRLVETADARSKGRLEVPVRLLLDEFANIVSIPEFEKKIATVRSRGIDCHVIIQGLPQLERKYGRAWQEIKTCCDTTVVLGVKDDYTARYVSNMLGRCTVETSSRSRDIMPLFGPSLFDERENRGTAGRELMTPDEIQKMRSKFCLVFLPDGTPPAKLRVVDYTEFPEARELKRVNKTQPEEAEYRQQITVADPAQVEPAKETAVVEKRAAANREKGSLMKPTTIPDVSAAGHRQQVMPDKETQISSDIGETTTETKETAVDETAGTKRAAVPWANV
ncbi:MAG: type IV secretory system conjugative DNA transfer family protein [Peptococcaceae bacterium]|nr:type IV secretory system conjugative DNA transfer family protein [Peptococcaceae bacterium]